MNKEQKKIALEWAREKYEKATDAEKKHWEFVFPELKESEDERVRKMLLDQMKRWNKMAKEDGVEQDVKDSDAAIAYLEKQKEQKPMEIHIDNPNIEKFNPDVKVTTSDSSTDGKELLYVCNKSYDIGFRDGVASVKPAEWSEEDRKMLDAIIKRYSFPIETDFSVFVGEDNLKDMREELGWLKSLRPQLKREAWTDEDSLAIKEIQIALEIYMINHGISEKQRKKLARWLDIHCNAYPLPAKLYPHWKPSEEQIGILGKVFAGCQLKDSERHSMVDLFYHLKDMI